MGLYVPLSRSAHRNTGMGIPLPGHMSQGQKRLLAIPEKSNYNVARLVAHRRYGARLVRR